VNRAAFDFERPADLAATEPPERRGGTRDGVRLLVTDRTGSTHRSFLDLPDLLQPGDLLVVNESATLPASLPARGGPGDFLLNVSTRYSERLWLAEARWGIGTPGPVPLAPGSPVDAGPARFFPIAPYPGIPRLAFYRSEGSVENAMARVGGPIQYGYARSRFPLAAYQTIFGRVPGSAEMPSAARPFTDRVLAALAERGVRIASLLLHTGVSSLESEPDREEVPPVYPEPFEVPAATASAVNDVRAAGGRVIAVGTTVLRALETAWNGCLVVPRRGFTQLTLGPGHRVRSVDALVTGFHDPRTSHLALLFGFAGETVVRASYREAVDRGYLWHEFGDSQLIWAA
jgi:S-adenosylmethionine:tRNA ribosyltransferase-isomerase